MNFMHGIVEEGAFAVAGTRLPLPAATAATASGRKVVMGVRPQDLGHAPSPEPNTLSGTVSLVELLGSEKLVEVELADTKRISVQVRSDTPVDIGDPFNVVFDPHRVHIFDADTGVVIR